MNNLPDIPRLYTALAEWLACCLYIYALKKRFTLRGTSLLSASALLALSLFLHFTGNVPLAWWIPCMIVAVTGMFAMLYSCLAISWIEAGYCVAGAFILAEFAASLEWQLHCLLWPTLPAFHPLAIILLLSVYALVYGTIYCVETKRIRNNPRLGITHKALISAVIMAVLAFAVSNLSFTVSELNLMPLQQTTFSVFYIRTLVDLAGVLLMFIQLEQLMEAGLNKELAAMNKVLMRQYEQYQQSRECVRIINRYCHDLKTQIASIRADNNPVTKEAAWDALENGIVFYEAQVKTGHPVLDTLLTTKSLYCHQNNINFTCVADGALLNFMSTDDICTVIGTALDNACESVSTLQDNDKKLIKVAIYSQHDFVMLRFENYCENIVELNADGMPPHGYGVRTIQAAAAKYEGTVTVGTRDKWFVLRILFPKNY